MKKRIMISCTVLFFCMAWIRIVSAQISVLRGLSHEKKARPGGTYEGEIIIKNKSQGIQEVKLYQTDYLFFCDGKNIYGEPGKNSRSNATWINFYPKRFKMGAKQKVRVHYTVTVPKNEGLVGTYWSMLMVEPIPKDSPESSELNELREEKISVGVRQIFRYGIQIATHINETGVRMLKFIDTKLLKEEENRILRIDIENIGERFLWPSLLVELFNEKGDHIGKYEGGRFRTFPGTSVRYRVDLGNAAEGIYKALVVADCGGDDIFGATYNLKIRD